ncbi:MAG: zinc-binding dehydrogenase [Rhizobiales bacterium]|nr:zinc-binding dehydrogenase [Hyphomicrobiales bacterium]
MKVIVDKVYPFAEIGRAPAYVENEHVKGRVVVKMS